MSKTIKEVLKGIVAGLLPVSALKEDEQRLDFEYALCSGLELDLMLQHVRRYGPDPQKWPQNDLLWFERLLADLPARLPREYEFKISTTYNRDPVFIYVTKYKDHVKSNVYQLVAGYDREEHPHVIYPPSEPYFERFYHLNLNDENDFKKVIPILHNDLRGVQRSENDQIFLDILKERS